MEYSNYKLNLIDTETGCIVQKDWDYKPTKKEINQFRYKIRKRKDYKICLFDYYEIMKKRPYNLSLIDEHYEIIEENYTSRITTCIN